MTNPIVTVNVSQQQAPTPNKLQRTGAFISQGGTNTAAGILSLITQLADLTAILKGAQTLTALTQSAGVATGTISGGHGFETGDAIPAVIAGCTPAGYNGAVTITITSSTQFTYSVNSGTTSPASVLGTLVLADRAELLAMGTTFFAQGGALSVYVLELGEGTPSDGVAALSTWITDNPATIYSWLVPEEWDANSDFLALVADFEAPTSQTYFFVTTTTGTYTSYTAQMKCVFALVKSPGAPATEFACAAPFYATLNYNPGSTNNVTQLAFSFLFGVTPYPLPGNGPTLAELKAANVNYVGTGAEGGLSNAILFWGKLKDGNSFNYWYSVDWVQINIDLTLANLVINGSNDPLAPLIYNQQGIDRLQDAATSVFASAVSFGLATGTVKQTALSAAQWRANFAAGAYAGQLVVNAEPFAVYTAENPNDYGIGKYAGLGGLYRPAQGFDQIIFDLFVVNFV